MDFGMPAIVVLWLVAAVVLGASGTLTIESGQVPVGMFLAVTVPIAAFLILYSSWPRYRQYALTRSAAGLTLVQSWRVIGILFIALYFYGVLPGAFAWPAGLGDVAIGVAAPFVALRLARNPEFLRTRGFVSFHLLGILDFVVAVGVGISISGAIPALATEPSTNGTMTVLPLSLIPTFAVPLWTILHLMCIFRARSNRRA